VVVEIAVDTVVEPVALALDEGSLDLQVERVHVEQSRSPRDPLELAKTCRKQKSFSGSRDRARRFLNSLVFAISTMISISP